MDLGLTAGVGWGAQIGLGWQVTEFLTLRVDGAAHWAPEQRQEWGSWRTWALHGGVSPCCDAVWRQWQLSTCLGVEALAFAARARGVQDARRVMRWAPALAARLESK